MRQLVLCVLVLAALAAPGRASAAAPPNDDFDAATIVQSLPFSETENVEGATHADDDPYTGWFGGNVWYRFTPANATSIEVDTAGSNAPASVCIYEGTRGALGQIACSGDGFDAHLFAELQAGVSYSFLVDIKAGCCGQTLTFALRDRTVPNDDFAAATPITKLPYQHSQDVLRATSAPDDPWCLSSSTNTVWFSYTAPSPETAEARTFGSDYDTRICAWTGERGALSLVSSNDDSGNTYFSDLVVELQPGVTYWFEVATNQPGASSLDFDFDVIGGAVPVTNDDFDSALTISGLPYTNAQEIAGATGAVDDPDCLGLGNRASVWYAVTPATNGTLDVSTAGSTYNTALAAYTGTRGALYEVPNACNDNIDAYTPQSQVAFAAQAGVTYYVLVTAADAGPLGTLQLAVRLILPPLTLKLAVDPAAIVDERTGTAVLTGSLSCNRAAKTTITANLGEQLGSSPYRTGSGRVVVSCDGGKTPTAFAIPIQSTSDPGLSEGAADAKLFATACASGCAKTSTAAQVQLVKKLK